MRGLFPFPIFLSSSSIFLQVLYSIKCKIPFIHNVKHRENKLTKFLQHLNISYFSFKFKIYFYSWETKQHLLHTSKRLCMFCQLFYMASYILKIAIKINHRKDTSEWSCPSFSESAEKRHKTNKYNNQNESLQIPISFSWNIVFRLRRDIDIGWKDAKHVKIKCKYKKQQVDQLLKKKIIKKILESSIIIILLLQRVFLQK